MNKLVTFLVGVAVVALVAIGISMAIGDGDETTTDTNQQNNTTNNGTNTEPSTTQEPTSTDKASIVNLAFAPANITVEAGTTVTWTNNDAVAHTVTVNEGDGPKSQTLENGERYDFTFNQTGTFNYHCSIHPEMTGSVTVQ